MSMTADPARSQPGGVGLPTRGAFAVSEVLPLIQRGAAELARRREEWRELRDKAAEAKALAKKTRADLIVYLRVWGLEATGGIPIKTSVERNEWADASANVQEAELAADLAQSAAMNARAALDEAMAYFESLRSMLAMERDENNAERGAPHVGP